MRCNNCTHYDVCYQYDILEEDADELCALYEQKRPNGEWIDRSDGGRIKYPFWERYECSKCGAKSENTNFCSNCGADMREGEVNDFYKF